MNNGTAAGRYRLIALVLFSIGMLGSSLLLAQTVAPAATATGITNALCGVVAIIADVIGVLAILMFVLGGTLYGFAHFMPASGNMKGSMQGWGMGILMGSIVMLILYLLAPFIIGRLISASNNSGGTGAVPPIGINGGVGCTSSGTAF